MVHTEQNKLLISPKETYIFDLADTCIYRDYSACLKYRAREEEEERENFTPEQQSIIIVSLLI